MVATDLPLSVSSSNSILYWSFTLTEDKPGLSPDKCS